MHAAGPPVVQHDVVGKADVDGDAIDVGVAFERRDQRGGVGLGVDEAFADGDAGDGGGVRCVDEGDAGDAVGDPALQGGDGALAGCHGHGLFSFRG